MISKQPGFKTSTGKMFEELVLSWLYTHSNCSIPSIAAQSTSSQLKIPACGENNTLFFDSKTTMENGIKAKSAHPLMLIPTSLAFPTADAIILTKTYIITVQITLSASHSASNTGFDLIGNHLPSTTKKSKKWRHVFITDNLNKAASLRHQTFNDLPSKYQVFSAVFEVGKSIITHKHVKYFKMK